MNIVILAAGKGKRMHSNLPKVLQPVGGIPMVVRVVKTAMEFLGEEKGKIFAVVGHGRELVEKALEDYPVTCAEQKELLGTGHALMQVLPQLDPSVPTVVLFGDVPLIRAETLHKLAEKAGDGFGILTIRLQDPTGYGRIVRGEHDKVVGIVEQKDLVGDQGKIDEVNTGIMVLPTRFLKDWLSRVKNNNNQGEYYLTDLVGIAAEEGVSIHTASTDEHAEVEGANNMVQLSFLERSLQERIAKELMLQGVRLADPKRIDVRGKLVCGKDVSIDVGCVFEGNVVLADGAAIGPYCHLKDTEVGPGVRMDSFTHTNGTKIGGAALVGPFARLRPGTVLADEVHVGDFVEIKKSVIGRGSKVNHLSYIGDCDMGSGVNIGAGTITCNYDGANKFKTIIEDDVFIGSDTQLVAPVTVEKGATVGAGSTITKTVPADTLAISRARQITINGWKRPVKGEKK